jgi:hypothetical protein
VKANISGFSLPKNELIALCAAALFGASTPFAKLLIGDIPPVLLAGLLYLGSGLGPTLVRVIRDGCLKPTGLPNGESPWLFDAIFLRRTVPRGMDVWPAF